MENLAAGPSVLVMPARREGAAVVAVVRPVGSVQEMSRPVASTRAGGFLGLSDEPVYEEAPVAIRKKSLWQRFWGD
jgi:hypothetical protein